MAAEAGEGRGPPTPVTSWWIAPEALWLGCLGLLVLILGWEAARLLSDLPRSLTSSTVQRLGPSRVISWKELDPAVPSP
jgi:hypothetical protein